MHLNPSKHFPFIGIFGGIGFASGTAVSGFLACESKMNLETFAIISSALFFAFILDAFITKIITGKESYVLYRGLLRSIAVLSLVVYLRKEAFLPWLDVFAIGFCVFHFFGRIGCFFGGCCHGKLSNFGVKYGDRYSGTGFPSYLINRKIFPTQLLEASCLLVIAVSCLLFYSTNPSSGIIFSWYIVSYALIRFLIEFIRGDLDRPHFVGFSEAQWTSAIFIAIIILLEASHVFPFSLFQTIISCFIIGACIVIYFKRKKSPELLVNLPLHVDELIRIADKAIADNSGRDQIPVLRWTSQDICMSLTALENKNSKAWHVAFSTKKEYHRKARIENAFAALHKTKFHEYTANRIAERKGVTHYQLFYKTK